ncbi:gliding motility-associated protein GldE [Flavobacterium sp. GT3R68]|uniref:gliding motility-associated protein GldE n=1 Tax=Flavobacterium sp. GT3R68 TaxID=2594437 RepID=UPI000F86823B|nr:gliding motility-associated protein GldE [Flavobacterium sp. GT3R68]RTY93995.1 gliding motility-associated protein GldE [Flavobacterium sp. GSN2]TRW93391.1 gliding motility-associated protein GldE [Flavobacterium sp. GT3R68]
MDPEPPSFFISALHTDVVIGLPVMLFLLVCAALISGAEVAFFSLTPQDLEDLDRKHQSKSQLIRTLLDKPKKLLATLIVAGNFTHIGIIILFFFLSKRWHFAIAATTLRFFVEILAVAFLILLFGEVLPKVYASRNIVRFAKFIAKPLAILNQLLSPISLPMRSATIFLHEKLGRQKSKFSVNHLSQALELTSSEGTSPEEQKLLEGIVSFGNTDTKQVMSPRIDIFALEIDEAFDEIMPKIIENGFSRIPVFRDSIDQIEGVLFVKDLIPHIDKKDFNWVTLLRPPFFVPESKKLDNLLKDFQSMKNHLAIVVDEYGGTSGLVSLEDVIEEIVGDISDEFDADDIGFSKINDKNFLFEGKTNLKDFYRLVEVDTALFESSKGEAETLGGFILEILGNFPKKGQKINFSNCLFSIEAVDKKRIKQIKITIE